MKQNVTFGHILVLLSIVGIPLITWGVGVETRNERLNEITRQNTQEIRSIKSDQRYNEEVIQNNHLEVMLLLKDIKIELKDKQNRDDY